MTLPPLALARVRYQLAQHDTLEPVNRRLDEALAWLGVQQRLVRDDGLHWQAIPDPAPLIEAAGNNTLHVKYLSSSKIELKWLANAREDSRTTVSRRWLAREAARKRWSVA